MTAAFWMLLWIGFTLLFGCGARWLGKRHQRQAHEIDANNDDDELIQYDEDATVFNL